MPLRALAIGAHPDDVELGCGGLVALLVQGGVEVTVAVVTDGGASGRNSSVRYAESITALRLFGVKSPRFEGVADGYAARESTLRGIVESWLRELGPDWVLCHAGRLAEHRDHIAVAAATLAACSANDVPLLGYEVPTYNRGAQFVPKVFVEVGALWSLKSRAILTHHSEIQRGGVSAERAWARARDRGREAGWGETLAEAFDVECGKLDVPAFSKIAGRVRVASRNSSVELSEKPAYAGRQVRELGCFR